MSAFPKPERGTMEHAVWLQAEAILQTEEITGDRVKAQTIVNRLACLWAREGFPFTLEHPRV